MNYEKELLLNEIKDQIGQSKSLIVAQYGKLPPDKVWGLRSNLAKNKSALEVVRKRVFLKAADLSGIHFFKDQKVDENLFVGNISVVLVNQEESMSSLKELFKFKGENADLKLNVLCGYIDGQVMTGAEVEYLSKLPTLDEMRSQFIGLLVAPMTHMLSVLEEKIKLDPSSATAEPTTQTE